MVALDVLLNGVVLGGLYALVAIGLNFQYGIARIMNLSYGEGLMLAAFSTFWLYTLHQFSPLLSVLVVIPVAFVASWLIFLIFMQPMVKRALNRDMLERDSILVTFGLLFVVQGGALWSWGSQPRGYLYLSESVGFSDVTFVLNRLLALALACLMGVGAWLFLRYTRIGTAMRAVSVDPVAAQLVAIDVRRYSGLAFAIGGAMVAASGALISMFWSVSPYTGIEFTLKALIVVILGGVGHMMGALVAGVVLGVAENVTAYLLDPGLTLAVNFGLFLIILLVRPTGIFGRR